MWSRFLAGQLARPSGLFGRHVLAPLWNRRNAALNDAVLMHLELRADDRVLDVGFGGGYLIGRMLEEVSSGLVAGVDASVAMVDRCQRDRGGHSPQLDLRCGDVEALPFPNAHFTKACSVNSYFYWRDVRGALAELFRVLRPGGVLVVCGTERQCIETKGFARHGLNLAASGEIRDWMTSVGFANTRVHRASDRDRLFTCSVGVVPPA